MAKSAGAMTEYKTNAGRPIYISPEGEIVSEQTVTLKIDGKFVNVPTIHDGIKYDPAEISEMIKSKEIKPTSTHKSVELAEKAAKKRSESLMDQETMMLVEDQYKKDMIKMKGATAGREQLATESERGNLQDMSMEARPIETDPQFDIGNRMQKDKTMRDFAEGGATLMEEGGLKEEGGSVDPVSGNDVPPGSTKQEVRDDIPAQLSEGEFVFPADVVRYIGLENLMEIRQKAKMGLQRMDAMGQMGNSEEATMDDNGEYEDDVDKTIEALEPAGGPVLAIGIGPAPEEMAQGGMPQRKVMSVEQEMMARGQNNNNRQMQMARGGAVLTVEQEMMSKNYMVGGYVAPPNPMSTGINSPVPTSYMSPEQPQMKKFFKGGLGQQNSFFTPPSPTGSQTGLFRPEAAASLVPQYSQRQYYNPETGEIRVVNFISGRPAPPGVPPGFIPYDPSKVVEEETKKAETTQQNQEDSSDDRERSEARKKEYADSLTEINALSELSPEFKEWAEKNIPNQVKAAKAMTIDPLTGEISFPTMSFVDSLKGIFSGEMYTQLSAGLKELGGTGPYGKAYSDLAKSAGIDLGKYNLNNISAKLGLLEDVKNTIADPNFEAKREARSDLERDRGDYEVSGLTKEQVDAQIAEDLDEIADAIDRGDYGVKSTSRTGSGVGDAGLADGSAGVTGDPAGRSMGPSYSGPAEADQVGDSYSESQQKAEEAQEDDSAGRGGYSKGGSVKPKRKKGLGRLK